MQQITEILNLVRENNLMLKYICNYIIQKEQTQDYKDFLNNVAADMYVETLNKNDRRKTI